MTDTCMDLIYDLFLLIEKEAPWAVQVMGRLELLQMDAGFLKMFCFCLETWEGYPTTHLQLIWKKQHKGRPSVLNRLTQTWPVDAQHFNLLAFELEGIIQQSKLYVEKRCKTWFRCSSMGMEGMSSNFVEILNFLRELRCNMYRYRWDDKINFPFKKQIAFLEKSLEKVEYCENRNKLLQFMSFVSAFANSAACLTCLYWAREANEEFADEMNIVRYDMLQKFIPFAPDIITLYIDILDSQESHRFLLEEAIVSFTDFFFEHMTTVLKYDDYPILREKLIFIFTFLTGPPHEGDDLIRTEIYDLFRHEDDAYLLLPFDKIKRDFSDKNMSPLSDVMIKIELATTQIIQIYCRFSDSWSRLEAERMDCIYFVSLQRELSLIEKHAPWADVVVDKVQLYKMELIFLRMFLRYIAIWDNNTVDEEIREKLSYVITSLQGFWGKNGLLAPRLHAIQQTGDISKWHLLTSELDGNIHKSKLEIKAWCVNSYHCSYRCKPSACNIEDLSKFLNSILDNLNDLVRYRADKFVPFKKQIDTLNLKEKLFFLQNFLKLTAICEDSKKFEEFHMFVQVIANDVACLTFLYWAQEEEANGKIVTEMNLMIKPAATPDVARLYFRTLKALYMERSDSFLFGQTAWSFVDHFFEDTMKRDFQTLQDDIIFLLTFLNDPPKGNTAELICCQVDLLFWEGLCGLLPYDDAKHDFFNKKVLLSEFVIKIQTINANIKQLYCKFPDSSLYNFPMVVASRFLDFLIENLRNLIERMTTDRKYAPFAKHKIIKIEEELVSLRPFFNQIFMLRNELNATWLEVVHLIHLTEHVINSCISSCFVYDHPIWYHVAYLSEVFERLKVVKTMLENVTEKHTYKARCLSDSAHSRQSRPSEINEVVVGFEDEAEKIISMLTWGHTSLDIVSIVGMGGLGKTTMAKKVYGASLVKSCFDIFAFCTVSHDHDTRKILLDILRDIDIKGDENNFSDMSVDDLAHQLWKCLSRQKYLIVMDDIWDISAWDKVRRSFPDDKNGRRVLFTTRSGEVAEKCKIKCTPHHLRFMSDDESWELLRKKVFGKGNSLEFQDIGKLISKNCKGLPLAVAVIAGLLARQEPNQSLWREIAERLSSYLADEGCMNILELSYKHLPNYLKPCLIYLGAYPQDSLMKVKQVILLWIAEGFVPKSKIKRIEDVAREYLHDLVDRSFVLVNTRSSSGEIKTFRVHDLIHDLCQIKCLDGNFFQLRHGIATSSSLDTSKYNNWRVSTENINDITVESGLSFTITRSLLVFRGEGSVQGSFLLKDLKHAQVLHLEGVWPIWQENYLEDLTSLVNARHIEASIFSFRSIPSSIAKIWNLQSVIFVNVDDNTDVDFPETLWGMKSLRYVKVANCRLTFSDSHENEACPKLDKVVSFSRPILSGGKDVEQLLQRLPSVQELSCRLERSGIIDDEESTVETLDFYRTNIESLKLKRKLIGDRSPYVYMINFPSTLKKLTLEKFRLPWTAIPAMAELHCLRVLKLRHNSFPGTTLEMEEVAFENLIFFELHDEDLIQWNVAAESLPCLKHLLIECKNLEELHPCFGEISTLKRIVVRDSEQVENSALEVGEQQKEYGNETEVTIYNSWGDDYSDIEEESDSSIVQSIGPDSAATSSSSDT